MNRPLLSHPKREYNLYLSNYYAHQAKRKLATFILENDAELSSPRVLELIDILDKFKILDDIESKDRPFTQDSIRKINEASIKIPTPDMVFP